jgi:hypothetical protein
MGWGFLARNSTVESTQSGSERRVMAINQIIKITVITV